MIKRQMIFTLLLLTAVISPLFSDDAASREEFVENLEIKIAVIGPADPLYSWWGHVAWIVENTKDGASRFYDYGNFSFEQDAFLRNFIMGRMHYLKLASNPERQLKYNVYLNRSVTIYTLNVKPADKLRLLALLESDIRPENRTYLYNLFWDNCSTRIRDRMDVITDGEFSVEFKVPTDKTLRMQLRRSLYSNVFMDWLLNFALSGITDRTSTEWEGMFLPAELGRGVETMMVRDESGNEIPFVKQKIIYNTAEGRHEIPDYPPANWYYGLISGIILAAAALLLKGKGRDIFSLSLSFIFALFGALLFFLAVFTDHNYSHWNMNLLFVNPFLFVTFAFSIRRLRNKTSQRSLNICWLVTLAGGLISILLKVIPLCRQNNWETILLVLPPALLLSGVLPILKKRLAKDL